MANIKQIEESIKNTVGYSESDNKNEFLKGAYVGIGLCSEAYKNEISLLERKIQVLESDNYSKECSIKEFALSLKSILNYVE